MLPAIEPHAGQFKNGRAAGGRSTRGGNVVGAAVTTSGTSVVPVAVPVGDNVEDDDDDDDNDDDEDDEEAADLPVNNANARTMIPITSKVTKMMPPMIYLVLLDGRACGT